MGGAPMTSGRKLLSGILVCLTVLGPVSVSAEVDRPVEKQIEWRRLFGLSTDRAFVARVSSNVAAQDSLATRAFGVPLTASEGDALFSVRRLGDAVAPIRAYGANETKESFADLFIDGWARGGYVNVGFTRDADLHLGHLRARFEFPERLRVFEATFSIVQLSEAKARLSAIRSELSASGILIMNLWTDVRRNQVVVGVSGPWRREAVELLSSRFEPGLLRIEFNQHVDQTHACNSTTDCWPPQTAGVFIHAQEDTIGGALPHDTGCTVGCGTIDPTHQDLPTGGTYTCNSGFSAFRVSAVGQFKIFEQLTAGHCVIYTSLWKAGLAPNIDVIGSVVAHAFKNDSKLDAAVLDLANQTDKGAYFWDSPYQEIGSVQTASQDNAGDITCMMGHISRIACGMIETKNYDHYTGGGGLDPRWIIDQRRAEMSEFDCNEGDSGAPWWTGESSPWKAVGIHSGGNPYSETRRFCHYGHVGYLGATFAGRTITRVSDL